MSTPLLDRFFANHFINRVAHKAGFAAALLLCGVWSTVAALAPASGPDRAPPSAAASAFQEWPSEWDGAPLRPLALGEVEQRFAEHFPGAIARLSDGRRMLVLRRVDSATRMLHPATDCYRALGYRIAQARLERDLHARLWRCFVAERPGGQKLRVCERIVGAEGDAFTDTSAWYWAAAGGRSKGPWQAATLAQPIDE
jgi:hypothetical protein